MNVGPGGDAIDLQIDSYALGVGPILSNLLLYLTAIMILSSSASYLLVATPSGTID